MTTDHRASPRLEGYQDKLEAIVVPPAVAVARLDGKAKAYSDQDAAIGFRPATRGDERGASYDPEGHSARACASMKRRRSCRPRSSSRSCRLGRRAHRDWAEWCSFWRAPQASGSRGEAAPRRLKCGDYVERLPHGRTPDRLVGGSGERRPLIGEDRAWKARSVASALLKARAERPPLPACRRRSVANPSTGRTPPPSYPRRSSRRPGDVRLASAAPSFP